jgi:mRNA interferase MazF
MAHEIERGEIWLFRFAPPDRRRPVLVLSRSAVLRSLRTATVAAITSSLHGSPTEVEVGVAEGLKNPSCVNLVNVFTVPQSALRRWVGSLEPEKMREVCRALNIAVGCA